MALERWTKIDTKIKDKNPFWTYKVDKFLLPEGMEIDYYYCFTYGSVFIIPVNDDGKITMVNQYRCLNSRFSWEFPGGSVKKGEDPLHSARKELIEETGTDGELEKAGEYNPCNGLTNEICHVFIARNLKPSDEFKKDGTEDFERKTFTIDEIEYMISTNEIYDGMTLASWALARKKLMKFVNY